MKILLVEDDDNKGDQLCMFLEDTYGARAEVTRARSYHSAVLAVSAQHFDLVLLDMTIPTFDITPDEPGGQIEGYGGRDFLEELDRLGIKPNVIVVTQFDRFGERGSDMSLDELAADLSRSFPETYRGAVYYSSAREGWRRDLQHKIAMIKSKSI
jgi:CheY-like chemotaxis protein